MRSACGASCDHFEALPECLAASSAKGPLEPRSEAALRAAAMVPARGPSQAMLRNRLRSSGVAFVIPPEKQVSNGMCFCCVYATMPRSWRLPRTDSYFTGTQYTAADRI